MKKATSLTTPAALSQTLFSQRSSAASMVQSDARPTGDQDVVCSIPAGSGNILSWRLITKYFLRSFTPADSGRVIVSFWRKNEYMYWVTV